MSKVTQPRRSGTGERRDWFRFDRADRWGLALILGVGVLVALITEVVAPIVSWASGDELAVPYFSEVAVPGLGEGLGHTEADYSILIRDPSARQRLLDLLPGMAYVVLAAVVAWLLLRLMQPIGRGEPFSAGTVRRLRALALVLMIGWTVAYFLDTTCTFAILSDLDLGVGGGPRTVLTLPVVPFVAGLITAMVAEAFKAGARLQDDVDGLV